MDKCPGDPPGISGIPGGSPGGGRGGGRGDPRGGARPGPLFWGRTFRGNLPKTLRLPSKKTIQELRELSPRQSISVNLSYTQPAVPPEVVFSPRLGTTLLHAPGTKMT